MKLLVPILMIVPNVRSVAMEQFHLLPLQLKENVVGLVAILNKLETPIGVQPQLKRSQVAEKHMELLVNMNIMSIGQVIL